MPTSTFHYLAYWSMLRTISFPLTTKPHAELLFGFTMLEKIKYISPFPYNHLWRILCTEVLDSFPCETIAYLWATYRNCCCFCVILVRLCHQVKCFNKENGRQHWKDHPGDKKRSHRLWWRPFIREKIAALKKWRHMLLCTVCSLRFFFVLKVFFCRFPRRCVSKRRKYNRIYELQQQK